jgi:hypothetical protein
VARYRDVAQMAIISVVWHRCLSPILRNPSHPTDGRVGTLSRQTGLCR